MFCKRVAIKVKASRTELEEIRKRQQAIVDRLVTHLVSLVTRRCQRVVTSMLVWSPGRPVISKAATPVREQVVAHRRPAFSGKDVSQVEQAE
jgi:hypothetical protein